MPAFVKTERDEKVWQRAKDQVSVTYDVPESKFKDKHWSIVNTIYHKIKAKKGAKR